MFSNKHNGFRGHGKEKPSNVEIFCLFNCLKKKKRIKLQRGDQHDIWPTTKQSVECGSRER
jgi:hypothetical protein